MKRLLPVAAVISIVCQCLVAWGQPPTTSGDGRLTSPQAERYMSGFSGAIDRVSMRRALTASLADLDRYIRGADVRLASVAVEEAERRKTPQLVAALGERMLNPADTLTSARSAETLRLFDTPESRALLHQGLKDRRLEVRARAAVSLAELDDRTAIPVLREGLTAANSQTRILSAGFLGKFRDTAAVPALIRMAETADEAERRYVCNPLADMATPAAIRKLERMATEEKYGGTRAVAVRELGRVAKKGSLPVLLKALNDKTSWVRYEAVLVIERIGDLSAKTALQKAATGQAPDEASTGYGRRARREAERVLNLWNRKRV